MKEPQGERLTARDEGGHAYFPQCFEEPCDGHGCAIEACDFLTEICERLCDLEDKLSAGTLTETVCCGDCLYCERHGRILFCERQPRVILVTSAERFCSEGKQWRGGDDRWK